MRGRDRGTGSLPLVVVLLGTGRRRFDRLVRWAGELSSVGGCSCFVQHGATGLPSLLPSRLDGVGRLGGAGLSVLLDRADCVVTAADPELVAAARDRGHLPVVVPRDPALAERGARRDRRRVAWLVGAGAAVAATSQADFEGAVHRTLLQRGAACPFPRLAPAPAGDRLGTITERTALDPGCRVGVR